MPVIINNIHCLFGEETGIDKQHKTQSRAGQGRAGQGSTGQHRAGQGRAG